MKRMYVLCRKDLGPVYAAVQGAHAVAQHCLENPETWKNEYLIFLEVKDERELWEWSDNCSTPFVQFFEPDLGGELTAIALVSDGQQFKNLNNLNCRCS